MKSVVNALLTLTLLIGLAASSILAAADDSSSLRFRFITIGQFAVAVAKAMDDAPETRATLSPEAAIANLKESGLGFSAGSDAILTQAELAAFLRQSGVKVSVPSPDQPVSPEQARAVISGFGSLFASRSSTIVAPPVVDKNHGNNPLLESFADCAALPKVPDCRECCMNLGLTSQACGRACGRAHAAHNVSSTEPTP